MGTEVVKVCPVCRGTSFSAYLECKDHTYSQDHFHIQQCSTCELLLTSPRPEQESIGDYYKSEDYISHSGKSHSIFDWLYLKARNYTLSWKLRLIQNRKSRGTILDYGCGTGEFINYMAANDWNAVGLEPSDEARAKINSRENLNLYRSIEELPDQKFDVITLWHVLEHVPEPASLISRLKQILKKDGLIFVAVPNHNSYDAQHYKKHWAAYDVPRHFWHFSQNNLMTLLNTAGLQTREILPMKLDAYYVSLLSEKYKNHKSHNLFTPFKAFVTAWRSNRKARKKMNYSSLIYIASHA